MPARTDGSVRAGITATSSYEAQGGSFIHLEDVPNSQRPQSAGPRGRSRALLGFSVQNFLSSGKFLLPMTKLARLQPIRTAAAPSAHQMHYQVNANESNCASHE